MLKTFSNKKLQSTARKVTSSLVLSARYKLHDMFVANSAAGIFSEFVNKKVVVVGPGEGPTEELERVVSSADICVLINKGYRSGHFFSLAKKAKQVILFHCLYEDEERGGGLIDELVLKKINVQKIIYPLSEKELHHHYLATSRKLKRKFKLLSINRKWYEKIVHQLDGYRPNTGFATLALLVQSGCSNLYIHGFAFFRTPYQSDYRPNLSNISDSIDVIESGGIHNPDKDLLLFKELIRGQQKIQLSNVMYSVINSPFENIFYR